MVLGGTPGEASVLSTEEKSAGVKFAVEKQKVSLPVILNIAEGTRYRELFTTEKIRLHYCKSMSL